MARIWALRDAEDQKAIEDLHAKRFPDAKPEDKLVQYKLLQKDVQMRWPGAHEKSMRIYWQAHNDMPWRAEAL